LIGLDDLLNDHAPKSHLTNHLVQRPFADKKFLCHIAETVKGSSSKGEQVALQLIAITNIPTIGAGDVVACDKQPSSCHTNKDAANLSPVVANFEEKE
jgi:hypothetical protein